MSTVVDLGQQVPRRAADTIVQAKPLRGLAPCFFYLIVEFGRPMDWFPVIAAIRPGLIAGLWGIVALSRHGKWSTPRPVWYMLGLLGVMAWNVPWAVNNAWAFWGFQGFAVLVIGCVLPLAVLPGSLIAVRALMTFYVFAHLPVAVFGILNKGRGVGGWAGDENDLALALNVSIAIAMYLLIETRKKGRKLILAAIILTMLLANISTISRGGFIGLASVAFFMLVAGPYRRTILTSVAVASVSLALLAPASYWQEVRSIATAHHDGDTGEQRFYLWGMAWRMFLDHPLVGVGTRNYGIRAPEYEDTLRANTTGFHTWGRVAHSLYMTVLAEQGLVGTLFFVAVLGWCYKVRRRLAAVARREPGDEDARTAVLLASGLIAGGVAVLATGIFLSVLYYPLLWVAVGMLAALERVSARPAEVEVARPIRSAAARSRFAVPLGNTAGPTSEP